MSSVGSRVGNLFTVDIMKEYVPEHFSPTAIIGNGVLASSIANKIACRIFDRKHWDLRYVMPDDVLLEIVRYDKIVFCAGICKGEPTEIFQVNFMAPINLIENLIKCNYQGHLVLIGSHAASWVSWPEIDFKRLCYNVSKNSLRNLAKALVQSSLCPMSITIFEPTKFASPMNGFTGGDPSETSDVVIDLLRNKKFLHVEMQK